METFLEIKICKSNVNIENKFIIWCQIKIVSITLSKWELSKNSKNHDTSQTWKVKITSSDEGLIYVHECVKSGVDLRKKQQWIVTLTWKLKIRPYYVTSNYYCIHKSKKFLRNYKKKCLYEFNEKIKNKIKSC